LQRYFARKKNDKFIFNETDIHHIKDVMRCKPNDKIEVVSDGILYICEILNLVNFDVEVLEEIKEANELDVHITIAFGLIKENKMDFMLQKATELGISEFIPLNNTRSVVNINAKDASKKIDRWTRICVDAGRQSKRTYLPKVKDISKLENLIKEEYNHKYICSLDESAINLKKVLVNFQKYDRILFVVGPEGGFTKEEEEFLINNSFSRVSLGSRVLRSETVALFLGSVIGMDREK